MDVNNQAPKFTKKNYVTHIQESTPEGKEILTLEATDADEGAELVFAIDDVTSVVSSGGVPVQDARSRMRVSNYNSSLSAVYK